jgi:MoxR-like ATPase
MRIANEEVFGPVSVKGLENDHYVRITANKLPEATTIFIDEIWKGSSAILNTCLTAINERVFHNGPTPMKLPLEVIYAASNEIPQGEELAAMYDRFMLKYVVNPVNDDASAEALFTRDLNAVKIPTFTAKELAAERAAIEKVSVPKATIDTLIALRKAVRAEGIYVSDRKWRKTVDILKAFAHLEGKTDVDDDCLDVLRHMLWTTPDQIKIIARVVNKHTNPIGEQIHQLKDAVDEIMDLLANPKTPEDKKITAAEAQKKVKDSQKKLENLGDPTKNKRLAAAITDVKAKNLLICQKYLGLSI